jgi:hypothetical protein
MPPPSAFDIFAIAADIFTESLRLSAFQNIFIISLSPADFCRHAAFRFQPMSWPPVFTLLPTATPVMLAIDRHYFHCRTGRELQLTFAATPPLRHFREALYFDYIFARIRFLRRAFSPLRH